MIPNLNTNHPYSRGLSLTDELSDDEKKTVKCLVEVLDYFMLERPNIPLHHVSILLRLALDEGRSQKHYREALDYPASTMSRVMLDLGRRRRAGDQEGMGLLDERLSPTHLKEYQVFLSTKGRGLVRKALKKLRGANHNELR
jgi:DNA-binding MarR family transcriptional regulator